MISVLAQERLLGFALGTVSMGAFVLHQRRAIYRSLVDVDVAASGSPFSYQGIDIIGDPAACDAVAVGHADSSAKTRTEMESHGSSSRL